MNRDTTTFISWKRHIAPKGTWAQGQYSPCWQNNLQVDTKVIVYSEKQLNQLVHKNQNQPKKQFWQIIDVEKHPKLFINNHASKTTAKEDPPPLTDNSIAHLITTRS